MAKFMGTRAGLQQRIEESRVGEVVISGLLVVFLIVGLVVNLPDSPIRRAVQPAAEPLAVSTGLDQGWAMYANPSRRVDTVDVHVTMADGQDRVWTFRDGERGVGWWDRWIMMSLATVADSTLRPQLAHWVVRQVAAPGERPVAVAVVLRTETLTAPGDSDGDGSRRPTATKILYQESLR
jgi:hypothetical protein